MRSGCISADYDYELVVSETSWISRRLLYQKQGEKGAEMTTVMQTSTQHIANKFSWADKEYKTAYGSNASCFAKEKNCYDSWEELRSCPKSVRTSQISVMLKSHRNAANPDKEGGKKRGTPSVHEKPVPKSSTDSAKP